MVECKECQHYFVTIATVIVCLAATLLILKTKIDETIVTKDEEVQTIKVAGLILARGGSKGLPRKNLAIIQGKTLLARTIEKMKQIKRFNQIWVSTDDAEISKETLKAGALVHARHPATALDSTPSLVAVQEFMAIHSDVQIVAIVQCTSPFLKPEWLLEGYNKIVHQGYDSVFSVTRQRKLRWKLNEESACITLYDRTGKISEFCASDAQHNSCDKTLSAVNFDPGKRPRRQDWDGELVETGMFYFTTRQLIEGDRIQGLKIGCVEIPSNHSLEIDVELDLIVARSLALLFDSSEPSRNL